MTPPDDGRGDDPTAPAGLPFHPWPATKAGGSDPDRCPDCDQPNGRRTLRLDGGQWRRPQPEFLTCSRCSRTWTPAPIAEPALAASDPSWEPVIWRPGSHVRAVRDGATGSAAEPPRPQTPPRPCPECGAVAFMEAARDGTPLAPDERRCWGCDHVWRPQPSEPVVESPTTGAGPWHGALAGEETGTVIWRCSHDHARQSRAMRCASAELERRRAAAHQPELEAAR